MESIDIIQSFINDFLVDNSKNVSYLNLSKSDYEAFLENNTDFTIFDLTSDITPLAPFLSIIDKYEPTNDFIQKNSYQIQTKTFIQYFRNHEIDERLDIFVDDELYYEELRFQNTVISLLQKYCTEKYFILNSQYLTKETIAIIQKLEKVGSRGKFVFCFDSQKIISSSDDVFSFLDSLSQKNTFLQLIPAKADKTLSAKRKVDSKVFNYDSLLVAIKNARLFLSISQCHFLADWVLAHLDSLKLSSEKKRRIYIEAAIAHYYAGCLDEASLLLGKILENDAADDVYVVALLFMSKINIRKNNESTVRRYLSKAKELSKKSGFRNLFALASMLEYFTVETTSKVDSLEKYETALILLEKEGLVNNYVNTIMFVPWVFTSSSELQNKLLNTYIKKAQKIASEIDNKYVLSEVCHWTGILLSQMGKRQEALDNYLECNKIRTSIGEINSVVKIRNGLSYDAFSRADYIKSIDYIRDTATNIHQVEDFSVIVTTLKTIGRALFFARNFEESNMYFTKILHYMDIFTMEKTAAKLFFPELNDILIYIGLNSVFLNNPGRARMNYYNILNNKKHVSRSMVPLLDFLGLLLAVKEGNSKLSVECYNKIQKYFDEIDETQIHRYVFILYEYANLLKGCGKILEAREALNKGFSIAQKYNFTYYTKGKDSITLDDYLKDTIEFEPLNINFTYLEERTQKENLLNQLHSKIDDYSFLNTIMAFNNTTNTMTDYLNQVLKTIFDYSVADYCSFAEFSNDTWTETCSFTRDTYKNDNPINLNDLLHDSQAQGKISIIYNKDLNVYYCDLSKLLLMGAIILVPNSVKDNIQNEIQTLTIALTTIQTQLLMLKQNEHLLYISSTDQLSGLKNHRALLEHIAMESEKLSRYNARRKFTIQETIAFIDLDNFKYYNDNYGHEVGNLFIANFASLLTRVFRKVDFISRFGGDEFVLVLSDTSCQEAMKVIDRLYKKLDAEEHFIPILSKFVGDSIKIEPEHYLGFSVGLCSNYEIEDSCNLEKVLDNADQALYYSKNHGKGRVSVWPLIKDESAD